MKLIITLLALLGGASIALAADEEGSKKKEKSDSKSGESKTEESKTGEKKYMGPRDQAKAAEERFTQMDTNKDGFVGKDEYTAHPMGQQEGATERFGKLDRNNDDKLSKREFSVKLFEPGKKYGEGDKPGAKSAEGDKPDAKKKAEGDKKPQ